jgi:murein L,D-transpeptidase YafK
MKKKQSVREIATALREGGVESTSPNFENVLTGCLHRMKTNGDLLRFKEGWALAEFYPEHLRRSLSSQDVAATTKRKTANKKTKKAQKTAKSAKVSGSPKVQAAPESLEHRIEEYTRTRIGELVTFKQVAAAIPDTLPSVISLSLGRIAKKRGWLKTPEGAYHIMSNVQQMPKAV